MKRIYYDEFMKSPIIGKDRWLYEWAKRVFVQFKISGGKFRIKFNGLKVFKTVVIDGVDLQMNYYCPRCLRDYGEKLKMERKTWLFSGRITHRCPNCCFEA